MDENLNWKKRKLEKTELAEKLQYLVSSLVVTEVKDIVNKVESLYSMGVIKDEKQIEILRENIKQLQREINNGPFNNSKS